MDVNILLFHDFETLDAFGPIEILGCVEAYHLNYYSMDGGTIVSAQGASIVTKKLEDALKGGILIIPGGKGTRTLVNNVRFIQLLKEIADTSIYCLSICTGAALLAMTGLLDKKTATSNKKAFDWVVSVNEQVHWIKKARWVVDGKYYTSSGISAGMDMTLGFIRDQFGEQKALEIATHIEYIWNSDSCNDVFCDKEKYNNIYLK